MAGQVWQTAADGGYMYADRLSEKLRMQLLKNVKFRQFCDIEDMVAQGLHHGETWRWNVYSTVETQGSELLETQQMHETKFTVTQRSATVTERGNSIPYTGKLDDLSEHPVTQIIKKVLADDCKNVMDVAAHAQFNQTPLRVGPATGTSATAVTLDTNGTPSETNDVAFGKGHVQPIVDIMKERSIPPYENDDYYCIGWPTTFTQLRDDLEGVNQYVESGMGLIRNGETGRYRGVRFVEQNHIPKGGADDSVTWNAQTGTADPWNQNKSDWLFFFGADTVQEGIAIVEEVRGKIPGDYGRDRGVAWYAMNGFGLSHTDAENARIIKWDSAA